MGLKAVIDSEQFGELDEGTKSLYQQSQEDQSKYVVNVEGLDDHPHVVGLRNGHQRSKQERQQFKEQAEAIQKRFKPLLDLTDDPDNFDLSQADESRLEMAMKVINGDIEDPTKASGNNNVDVDKIKEQARKPLMRDNEQLAQERDQLRQKLDRTVIDGALSDAVSEVNVHSPYIKAVKAMFRDQVKVQEDENGNLQAVIESEYGEQPVNKFLKEWAQTDEGREFIAANNSGGGGAGGGSSSGKVKNPWAKDNWNMTEQSRIYREDPERAKRMAAEHGHKLG